MDPELPFLHGGPLAQVGQRLRLLRGDGRDVLWVTLALALVAWVPTLIAGLVAWAAGHGVDPVLLLPRTHVRWLVSSPLLLGFLLVEEELVADVVAWMRATGIVPRPRHADLDVLVARTSKRLQGSTLDLVLIVLGFVTALPALRTATTVASGWTEVVGSGLFRALGFVVLARWLAWVRLLAGMVGLGLDPSPLHPDGVGGLGILGIPSRAFGMVAAAFGSVASATWVAWNVPADRALAGLGQIVGTFLGIALLVGLGPLLLLVPTLLRARLRAQLVHGDFGERYARAFSARWLVPSAPADPLGTSDIQSLADTQASIGRALAVRVVPFGRDTVLSIAVCAVVPFAPCLLRIVPLTQVLRWLGGALA